MRYLPLLSLFALAACPKAKPPELPAAPATPADAGVTRSMPAPLAPHAFTMPASSSGTLTNGLALHVVENHEVPLWGASLIFRLPADAEPRGKEGLTDLLMAMLREGAGDKDAAAFARAIKQLGASFSTWAGRDALGIAVSGPTSTRDATLDLLADALLRPTFDKTAWDILHPRQIDDLKASLEDPSVLASRARNAVLFGDTFAGRLPTPTSLDVIALSDIKAAAAKLLRPDDAVLYVGGDITLADIQPALEARLASWAPRGKSLPAIDATPTAFDTEALYLVDKPGAAQSVLTAILPVEDGVGTDDYWAFSLANTAFGGAFTARLNMDLREDKGWTYGARCGLQDTPAEGLWICSTNVQADKTVEGLREMRLLLHQSTSDKPFTNEEIAYFQGSRVNAFAGSYETPNALLGELVDNWLYGRPDNWLETVVPGLEAVTTESANAAWNAQITPSRVSWIVVGDAATHRDALAALGIPLIELDANGKPVEAP